MLTGVTISAAAGLLAGPTMLPHSHGTDVLHLFSTTTMTNEGVETNASGRVTEAQNEQGNANHQSLNVSLRGLETNATYELEVAAGDDTNFTVVTNFDTDAKGNASLAYATNGNGHGSGHEKDKPGRGSNPLPDALNPVADIHAIGIVNSNAQSVLTADLTMPDRLQYLIKRDLSNTNGVEAELRIKANANQARFRLMASGLSPTNDYFLVFNGGIVETNSSNAKGRLMIASVVDPATDVLKIQLVELWDSSSNVVVSTELP
jgi:hypothetical protein